MFIVKFKEDADVHKMILLGGFSENAIWISRRARLDILLFGYFCRKHISFVEFLTAMRINTSLFQTPPI